MLIIFIRGIIVYLLVLFSTRVMGKRQLGELSPSELVITILLSNIATLSLEDRSLPLVTGVLPILTLVSLDVLASYVALKSRKIRHLITGRPKVIISNGVIDQAMLGELRFTVDDLCASLRANGIFDVTEVQYAVVETTGSISVLQKPQKLPLPPETAAGPPPAPADPPQILISDGNILNSLEPSPTLTHKELLRELKKQHISPEDVLLCLGYPDKSIKIIPKERK